MKAQALKLVAIVGIICCVSIAQALFRNDGPGLVGGTVGTAVGVADGAVDTGLTVGTLGAYPNRYNNTSWRNRRNYRRGDYYNTGSYYPAGNAIGNREYYPRDGYTR